MEHIKQVPALVWAVLVAAAAGPLAAQEPAAPAAPEAIAPAAEEENTAVQAVLQTNPTTPAELTRAAKILADLRRPDLAKPLLQKVLAAGLSQQELAQLEARFGSPMFLQMASRAELAPEARQLADAVLAAAAAAAADPQRLAALVSQLQDPSADARYLAMDQLRRARGAAVAPLLEVLADPARAGEHANVRAALVRLGSDAVGPLLGVLEGADAPLQVEAIVALGRMKSRQAVVHLLAPFAAEDADPQVRRAAQAALTEMLGKLPSQREAVAALAERAKRYLSFQEPLAADDQNRVEIWGWDATAKRPVAKSYSPSDAYRLYAARLARDAHAVDPADPQIRLLYLAATLEEAAHVGGLDQPLSSDAGTPAAVAAGFGVDVLEELLRYSMDGGCPAAATAAARLMGERGTAARLLYSHAEPGPLVVAARHADRRLRFAAAEAVMKLAPAAPYSGSSQVLDAVAFFAATSGSRRALVAGPVTAESLRVAGYLAAMDYEVETSVSGRGLIRLALGSPDYQLALVADSLENPTPDMLLQQLRHDGRTAALPVGILAKAGQLYRAADMAADDPLADAFPRPHDEESVRAIVARLTELSGPALVPHEERQKQAAAALGWLAELCGQKQQIYDLRRVEDAVLATLYLPQLGLTAVDVLGNLGTAKSQQALVEVASRWTLPIELRRRAALALSASIPQHGILLTSKQILLQYERYNNSANLDPDTQRVLGAILDAIEAPSRIKAEGGNGKGEGKDGNPGNRSSEGE